MTSLLERKDKIIQAVFDPNERRRIALDQKLLFEHQQVVEAIEMLKRPRMALEVVQKQLRTENGPYVKPIRAFKTPNNNWFGYATRMIIFGRKPLEVQLFYMPEPEMKAQILMGSNFNYFKSTDDEQLIVTRLVNYDSFAIDNLQDVEIDVVVNKISKGIENWLGNCASIEDRNFRIVC
jgi:hypothetical protein